MLEKFNKIYASAFEKIYIICFKSEFEVPILSKDTLSDLGKCYINTGIEWICRSKFWIDEFSE